MHTSQLIAACAAAALLAAGCNRWDTDENTRRAAAGMREVASRAGDQLADGWLTTKIQAQYFADDDIKARYINISARDGVVTIRGRVDTNDARVQALQIARNTDGVREVRDELAVGAPAAGVPEEADASWITTQIQARFFADSSIDGRDIQVSTQNGVVTLSGRVHTSIEKDQAVAIARDIDGVSRVDDRIVVQPSGSDGAVATSGNPMPVTPGRLDDSHVTSSIQAKFFLDNALKARRVQVETQQGVVTLRGEVASDDERAQALLLARTTAGVERVEDALTVTLPAASAPALPAPAAPPASSEAGQPVANAAAAADAAVTSRVQAQLAADTQAKTGSIEVTVKDGVVLLDGTMPTAAAKQRAVTLTRQAEGVTQVVDRITVRR